MTQILVVFISIESGMDRMSGWMAEERMIERWLC